MFARLGAVPTETLIDMLAMILAGERDLTSTDVKEVEQIQRELQHRAHNEVWNTHAVS